MLLIFLPGVAVIPAALQLLLLPMCPESPRFLLITKQEEYSAREGKEVMTFINKLRMSTARLKDFYVQSTAEVMCPSKLVDWWF